MSQDPYAALAKPIEGEDPYGAIAKPIEQEQYIPPAEEPGMLAHAGSQVASRLGLPLTPKDVSEAGTALGSDLWSMAKAAPGALLKTAPPMQAYGAFRKGIEQYRALKSGQPTPEQAHNEEQRQAGHSWPYRYLATPAAEAIGVNVRGMEEAAKQGSQGGVLGHAAAVPTATMLSYGAGRAVPSAARAFNAGRAGLAEKIVSPLVYEGTGEALADLRQGQQAARGIVREGLVGTKEGLVGKTGMGGKIGERIGELKSRADQILTNHPNSRVAINVEGDIDAAIDNAIEAEQKAGANDVIPRLENLRDALKTKFGKTIGTPKEINDLKTEIQETARGRGAYKNVVPTEGSTAKALGDVAARIRARVDQLVPEAADVNKRMSDLLDSTSPITKKLVQERGGGDIAFRYPGEKLLRQTVGSAPVRTGAARMLTLGQKAGMPAPIPPYAGPPGLLGNQAPGYANMMRARLARFNPPGAFPRRQLSLPGSIQLGSSMNPITPPGPPSVQLRPLAGLLGEGRIPLGSSMEGIEPPSPPSKPFMGTRAERLGLMLPEKAGRGNIGLQDYGYPSPAGPGEIPKATRYSPGRFVGETRNGRWWDGEKWRTDKPE